MRSLKFLFVCIALFFYSLQLFGQEVEDHRNIWSGGQKGYVMTGDLSILKGQKTFSVILDPRIKKMGVKELPDSIYLPLKTKEMNTEKAGTGDQWLKEWNKSQKNFKAAFIEGFNSKIKSKGVNIDINNTMAEYTFIIYTKTLTDFMGDYYIILDLDVVKTKDLITKVVRIRFPVNNSRLKSKQFNGKTERAYFGAGYLFAKYCAKNIF